MRRAFFAILLPSLKEQLHENATLPHHLRRGGRRGRAPPPRASTFSVGGNGNTFTITRSGEGTNAAETVHYRAVDLSAYAGQNFTSKYGSFTFAPGQTFTNVTVSTRTPSNNAYRFQSGTTRAYRFELLDAGGFRLSGRDRTITAGTSVSTNGAFNVKNVTIQSAEYTADDDGYDVNGYQSVSSNAYFSAATPKAYFQHVGAELRMTLSMSAKENDDCYQYLQLLVNETVNCDNRKNCSDGDTGNICLSRYMAGFEIKSGSKDAEYKTYTFTVTNVSNNAGAVDPWGYGNKYPLDKQKFNSGCRASDGRIVIPLDFTNLVLRLNASGSSGSDEWAAKNVTARIQAVDSTAPTLLGATVSPGPYHRGNTVTVSLTFSEIVVTKPSSGFFLNTSWGRLGYEGGTCGNVLTFSGKIAAGTTDNTPLSVTDFSGLTSVKDLAGNAFGGSVSCSLDASVAPSVDYAIAYDLAGGTLPPDEDPNPGVYNYDSDIILTNPVRPGYTFAGWSGTGFSGTRTTVSIYHSNGDRAYTAHWTPTAYTITYVHATNGVDGVVNANPTSYTIEDGTVLLAASTRTNYFFCGWYENPGFTGDPVSPFSAADLGDRTFYAKWVALPAISYIDADGEPQVCSNYTVIANAAGNVEYGEWGAENWYVVTNDVTISGRLSFDDDYAHLILCDGATLTVTNENGTAINAYGLTIYGQTNGTGAIVANGGHYSIYTGFATINGGSVTATGGTGISAPRYVIINGGTVTVEGNTGIGAFGPDSVVAINGGIVTATGSSYGISGTRGITLDWTNPTDSIYASSYNDGVIVTSTLTDGIGGIYVGRLPPFDLAGKTLRPYNDTPTYPAYLAEADNIVTNNYDVWAERYGYDALGVNETAFLLDVAPGAVTNGVTPLKIVELGTLSVNYQPVNAPMIP